MIFLQDSLLGRRQLNLVFLYNLGYHVVMMYFLLGSGINVASSLEIVMLAVASGIISLISLRNA